MHAEDFARDRHAQNRANEMSHDLAKSIRGVLVLATETRALPPD
jgi:hypothetical protein